MINWDIILYDLSYVAVAFLAIYFTGWVLYVRYAASGYSVFTEVFEKRNMAAGFEIAAFLALEFLIAVSALKGEAVGGDWVRDLEAVFLTILMSNLVFFGFRGMISLFVEWHFRGKTDQQGDFVTFNNEIFKQQNLAATFFSISFMILMYFMIEKEDFLSLHGSHVTSGLNMLGVFLSGVILYSVFNLWMIPKGHGLLQELFLDNNVAPAMSLCGFLFGNLYVQSRIIATLEDGWHVFNVGWILPAYFLAVLVLLLFIRMVFARCVGIMAGSSYSDQFVKADNPVIGMFDLVLFISCGHMLGTIIA